MKVTTIKTEAIRANEISLIELIDKYITVLLERSVVVITSKVVSLCEGNVVKIGAADVQELAKREAQYYMPPPNEAGYALTVNRNILISKAGIDESNTGGYYVLWPADPQKSANAVREHLVKKFGVTVGVILSDSRVTPMRRGVIGVGLAHSGFKALQYLAGQPDIFGGYELKYTYTAVLDGLTAAAVVQMGEGAQRTPIAIIEEADFVEFQDRNPSGDELEKLVMPMEEDIFADMLKGIPWDKRP